MIVKNAYDRGYEDGQLKGKREFYYKVLEMIKVRKRRLADDNQSEIELSTLLDIELSIGYLMLEEK